MAAPTKVVNFFSSNRKAFRYKFPCDELPNVIDDRIRYELSLPAGTKYSLIDVRDNSIIEVSTLRYLDDGSTVFIRMRGEENLNVKSFIDIESNLFLLNQHIDSTNTSNKVGLSCNGDNQQIILSDLSESSSTSKSNSKITQNYSSTASKSSVSKKKHAQDRRKHRELQLKANRKIHYFMQKYGKANPTESIHLIREILVKLDVRLDGLYNFLKYIRHNIKLSLLQLKKEDLVDQLFNVYRNDYINKRIINTKDNNYQTKNK